MFATGAILCTIGLAVMDEDWPGMPYSLFILAGGLAIHYVVARYPTGPTVFFNVINSTRGPIDATVQCFAYHANGSLLEVRSTVVKDVRARSDQYASIEFSNALPWIRNVACRIDQVNPAR